MLNIFQLKNNRLIHVNIKKQINSFKKIIWIDIIKPVGRHKNNYIDQILKKHTIKFTQFKNIKNNKRFFTYKNELHIRSYFFSYQKKYNSIKNSIVYFIIYNDCLFTIHEKKIPVFHTYQKSINKKLIIHGNAYEILLHLFEIKINNITDKIEQIYSNLETLNFSITNKQKINEYIHILNKLIILENTEWKIRINLLDTERTIKFLLQTIKLPLNQKQYADEIIKNIKFLLPYNEHISNKINFLKQTAMGFIDIEQNRIIKIFSIIFLPPTLIASSYGMNFEYMPELHWPFGYFIAIILMILTGLAPYLYFKYKNWL